MKKKTSLKTKQIIDESGKIVFIPADGETRKLFTIYCSKTIINQKELDAIVNELKMITAIESGEAKIAKFQDLKVGDEFAFATDTTIVYTLDYLGGDTAYTTMKKGPKISRSKLSRKQFASEKVFVVNANIESKKKIKYFQEEPLKTMEDYPEFIKKLNPKTQAELEMITNGLYKEAKGLWSSIKVIVDLISPFVGWFVKNPKLKQAYNLLVEVLREKKAIYGEDIITITAEEYLANKYKVKQAVLQEAVEEYMLDKGKTYNDATDADVKAVVSVLKHNK